MTLITCERKSDTEVLISADRYSLWSHERITQHNKIIDLWEWVYLCLSWTSVPQECIRNAYNKVYSKKEISYTNFNKFMEYIWDNYMWWNLDCNFLVVTPTEVFTTSNNQVCPMHTDLNFVSIWAAYLEAKILYEYTSHYSWWLDYWLMYGIINSKIDLNISKEYDTLIVNSKK